MTSEGTTETPGRVSVRHELLEASVVMARASAILAEATLLQTSPNLVGTRATAALELAQGAAALAKAGKETAIEIILRENA